MTQQASDQTELTQRFKEMFEREIVPRLPELEAARQRLLRTFYGRVAITAAMFLIPPIAMLLFGASKEAFLGVALAYFAVVMVTRFFWLQLPGARHHAALGDLAIPAVCRFFGELSYQYRPPEDFDVKRLVSVVPSLYGEMHKLSDFFSGCYRETDFFMAQMKPAERKILGMRNRKVSFWGLLFDIEVPVPFDCHIVMVSDKGALGNKIAAAMRNTFAALSPVSFDHSAFEDRYQVYCDNPDEARRLLNPSFLDAIVELAATAGEKSLNATLTEGRFLLALPRNEDYFTIGNLRLPLDHMWDDVVMLLEQVTIPHRLIDYLHGDLPSHGTGAAAARS